MLYPEHTKQITASIRDSINNGKTEQVLTLLDLLDRKAEEAAIDPVLRTAIHGLAAQSKILESDAANMVLYSGFYEIGRIKTLGGMSLAHQMLEQNKLYTIQNVLTGFGVKPMNEKQKAEATYRTVASNNED